MLNSDTIYLQSGYLHKLFFLQTSLSKVASQHFCAFWHSKHPHQQLRGSYSVAMRETLSLQVSSQPRATTGASTYIHCPLTQRDLEVTAPDNSLHTKKTSQHFSRDYSLSHHQHRGTDCHFCQQMWNLFSAAEKRGVLQSCSLVFHIEGQWILRPLERIAFVLSGNRKPRPWSAMLLPILNQLLVRTGWSGKMEEVLHIPLST